MTPIAVKDLLEAGVHFGHQTKRWNPKMKPYIFGERNGIYIIDLGKTAKLFREAEQFVSQLAAAGTHGAVRRHQAAGAGRRSAEDAQRCGMFYINERWLGGLLTNFTTIQTSLGRLRDLEAMVTDGRYDSLSKKEIAKLEKEKKKLQKNLDGIRHMSSLPDALFVVDTKHEQIAVDEARKLKIPVIGVVDTNCDPDQVDYVIPGNDDALRAIRLFTSRIADAVSEGRGMRESATADAPPSGDAPAEAPSRRGGAPARRRWPGSAASRRRRRPRPSRRRFGCRATPASTTRPAFPCTARRRPVDRARAARSG